MMYCINDIIYIYCPSIPIGFRRENFFGSRICTCMWMAFWIDWKCRVCGNLGFKEEIRRNNTKNHRTDSDTLPETNRKL